MKWCHCTVQNALVLAVFGPQIARKSPPKAPRHARWSHTCPSDLGVPMGPDPPSAQGPVFAGPPTKSKQMNNASVSYPASYLGAILALTQLSTVGAYLSGRGGGASKKNPTSGPRLGGHPRELRCSCPEALTVAWNAQLFFVRVFSSGFSALPVEFDLLTVHQSLPV